MASYGSLQFKEQVSFFRNKLNLPTKSYIDIQAAQHDTAFVVAGALKADLLADLRTAVDRVVADGITFEAFKKDFRAIAAKHGWAYNGGSNWRAQVIYETNLRQSYNAGREAQIASPSLRKARPYGLYRHYDSANERPEHAALNNLVIPIDDPWWDIWSPQNGWGCKCKKFLLSQRDLELRGLKVSQAPTIEYEDVIIGKRSGSPQTVRTPKGIDPGFAYRPGASTLGKLAERNLGSVAKLSAESTAPAAAALATNPAIRSALTSEFKDWTDKLVESGMPTSAVFHVGAISPSILDALVKTEITPQTAVIMIRAQEVLHVLQDTQPATRSGLPKSPSQEDFSRLPELLSAPRAVLLDRKNQRLIYVFDRASDSGLGTARIIVAVNYTLKTAEGSGKQVPNSVRTVKLAETADLAKEVASGTLELLEGSL